MSFLIASQITLWIGLLTLGGNRFLHNAGTDNTFVGALAGNTSMTGNTSANAALALAASSGLPAISSR